MADSSAGTFEILALELGKAIEPLSGRLHHEAALGLIAELGLVIPQNGITATLMAVIEEAHELGHEFPEKITALTDAITEKNTLKTIEEAVKLVQHVSRTLDAVKKIVTELENLATPITTDAAAFAEFTQNFFRRLTDMLIADYVESYYPTFNNILLFFGIIERKWFNEDSTDPFKAAFERKTIHYDRISRLFKDPGQLASEVYQWGTNDFDSDLLLSRLADIFESLGISVMRRLPDDLSNKTVIEIFLFTLQKTHEASPPGIEAVISYDLSNGYSLIVPAFANWDFELAVSGALDASAGLQLIPPADINLIAAAGAKGDFKLRLVRPAGDTPVTLLGITGDSGIFASQIALGLVASYTWNSSTSKSVGELGFEGEISGGNIKLSTDKADGFIGKVLGGLNINSTFNLGLGWKSGSGFYFNGSSSFEIKVPTHVDLGIAELSGVTLQLGIKDKTFPASFSTDIKVKLGVLEASIEEIGASVNFDISENSDKELGPLGISFGFKPPKGIGLVINAGAVMGGGYLFFDFDKEEYAGALELTIAGIVSAKAIGLITTKMPDGSKGFSLLIIITAEFLPPLQLSWGFTLNAVGGLVGLNRTVSLEPLRDAVRTGAVTSIMFPQNVVANAPRIISDLRTIFPPYEGKFLIGPMAKLGWGTPTLVSLSLGLIIEIPGNIAILGILKIALPEEHIPLVQIQVLFVGTIDFDKKLLTFDASLYQSFLLAMTLEGDMAVRLKWGNEPDFILTAGGFHPSYTPPPLALPTLRRLAISILDTDRAKIRVESYQAVTANTVQFGSKAEVYFDLSACSIQGHIGFDALFQFNPFYFIIEVSASFKLSAAGIDVVSVRVKMSLEGPTPWRAKGTGSVSFFFFSISADFDKTWGETKNTSLPDISILQRFLDEIRKREPWSTVTGGGNLLVSLRKFKETENPPLVLHPAGALLVQQKLVPLSVKFDKIGNQKTNDVQQIDILKAFSAGIELKVEPSNENFARAQYQNLSDADKLSKPSFEKMQGGVRVSLGAANIRNGKMVRKKVAYEIIIIDKEPKRPFKKGKLFEQLGLLFTHFLKGNSVAKSSLSQNRAKQFKPFTEKMNVTEEGYTVAFQSDNKPFSSASTFASEILAQTFMQEQLSRNPNIKKDIHIIPNYELQES